MKILIYSHFYYPEVGAASLRMQYFAKVLKENNHDVKIISPVPNYPHSKIYDGFNFFFNRDKTNNIRYLPIYIPNKHFFLNRGISYFSYAISSFFYTFFSAFRPELILASSPPIFTAFSAAILSKIKKSRFISDIRDVWPDIGIELGILKNNFVINILKKIEKFILNSSDFIIVTAEGDKRNIISKNIQVRKIKTIFNGADTDLFFPKGFEEKKQIRKNYNLPLDKKIIIYFGSFNYGMNDIETLSDVLVDLEEIKDKIFFVAVGNGDNIQNFINKIKDKINFVHLESLSIEKLAQLLSACDLSIIPRKKIEKDTGGNIPVKCFESWAAGIPVLLSNIEDSEISKIFDECKSGKLIEPNDKDLLKKTIVDIILNCDLNSLGKKGRLYMENNFNRKKEAQKLISLINNLDSNINSYA